MSVANSTDTRPSPTDVEAPAQPRAQEAAGGLDVSVVVPMFNEQDNVQPLYDELAGVLNSLGTPFEIILVDDGSTDDTFPRLCRIQAADPRVQVVRLKRNFGQSAAMTAGFDAARGDVVIPMDGDMQNDPHSIPALLAKLDEGYDVVSGWRRDRQDKALTRKLPSRLANGLIGYVTGVKLHDYGCTLKAYRRSLLEGVQLYGEMHRFIPAILSGRGARVTEIVVGHRARTRGTTKYGLSRTFRVLFDLLTVKFFLRFLTRPLHFFGSVGATTWVGASLAGVVTVSMKLFGGIDMTGNPLLLLTALLLLMGAQFVGMGILAELLVRVYHEPETKAVYVVGERRGGDPPGRTS